MRRTLTTAPSTHTESDAFEPQLWLTQHGDALYRYAITKVRRPEVAEDLVQETLLAAWKGRDRFHQRAQVRTWLIAILKRKVIDWLRTSIREQNNRRPVDDTWLSDQFTTHGTWRVKPDEWDATTPDAGVMREEFWGILNDCLDKLPPRLRHVFTLRQLDEKSADEVCQELNITPSNLWVMLHRSRMRLWRCLSMNWYRTPDTSTEKEPS
jgi:RNA polymerase sigma-70 factor (TIGR02943 family)